MKISIRELGGAEVLAGSIPGRNLFGRLVATLQPASEPEIYFLDFTDVLLATASFVREGVLAFRDYCRAHHPNVYPVMANLTPGTLEELELLLDARHDVVVVATLRPDGHASGRIIGRLDPRKQEALDAVLRLGEADAGTLAKQCSSRDPSIVSTVWHNRLAALATRGILIEAKRGNIKVYRPVVEVA